MSERLDPSKRPGGNSGLTGGARDACSAPGGEEGFRLLIENALDLVTVLDAAGTVTYVSPSVRHLLGYEPHEVTGRSLLDFVREEDRELARAALAYASSRSGVTGDIEITVRHRDGSWHVHEASSHNLLANPAIHGMVINSRDITARKQAERLVEIQRDLAAKLGAAVDIGEATGSFLRAALDAAGLDAGAAYIFDEVRGDARLVAHAGLSGPCADSLFRRSGAFPLAALLDSERAIYSSPAESIPLPGGGDVFGEGLKAVALVPLVCGELVIGGAYLASRTLEELPARARDAIEAMAAFAGQSVGRIRLNAAVRESERRYRMLHDYAGEAIFTYGRDLRIISVNRAACEKIGYREDELVGRNIFEVGILHPDDLEKAAANLGRLMAGETPARERLRMLARDGSAIIVDVTSTDIFDEEGGVSAVINIAADITDRVEAERSLAESRKTLATLMSNLPGMAYRCRNDRDWTMDFVSEGCLALTGYKPDDLVEGGAVNFGVIIHPDDRESVWTGTQEAVAKRDPFELVYRIINAAGEEKWVWEQGRGVFSELGELERLEGFISDITDYMRAQRLLRIQRDLAFRLSGEGDLDRIVSESLQAVLEATGLDAASVYLFGGKAGDRYLACSIGLSDAFVERVRQVDAGEAPLGVLGDSRVMTTTEAAAINPALGELLKEEGIRSTYSLRLRYEDHDIGSLHVSSRLQDDIPQRAREIAEVLAGQVSQAVERARLLSALRDSELRYRLLHDNAGEAIFTYGPDLRVMSVNRKVCEKIGYSEEELIGKNILELGLIVDEDILRAAREVAALLGGEKEVAREVLRLRRKDGEILVVDMTGAALRDGNGELIAISNIAMDITEQVRAEEALRVSEVTYREIFNAVNDAIAVHDIETAAIIDVNRKFTELFGYSREEALSISVGDISSGEPPFDQETAASLVRAAAAGEPQLFEWRCRTSEGKLFWAEVFLKRTIIAGQERVLAMDRDITERKNAERSLRESEERFRLLAENARDLVYRYRFVPDRGFEYVSPSATAITGYTPEEHYADPDLGFKMVHPDDRHLLEAASRGEIDPDRALELRWVRKDGSVIWTEQKNVPVFDEAGRMVALDGIARDITERRLAEKELRESEEKYRVTFESTGTAMGVVGPDGTIIITNSEFERMLGYARGEVEGRKRYWEFVHPDDVGIAKSFALRMARGELPLPFQYECRLLHRGGAVISVFVSVNAMPETRDSVVSLIDITEKKKYERRLEENAEQMRDFLDIAAHELRHPATLLKGYALTLTRRAEEIDGEARLESLRAIEAGADRLVYVVEELLDASRLQRGRFTVNRQAASTREIAAKAVEEMRMRGPGREITVDLPEGMDVALVDPDRLLRLFIILLDNAVKYSPPDSMVELKGEEREGELVFSVLDRGVGVAQGDEDRIFERFYQASGALHHTGPGMGLGLYIGKRIVEAHGGRIWCEPREGGGSAFRFSIPL